MTLDSFFEKNKHCQELIIAHYATSKIISGLEEHIFLHQKQGDCFKKERKQTKILGNKQ